MRFMVLIEADRNTEAGVMPSEELLTEMGRLNEELVNISTQERTGSKCRGQHCRSPEPHSHCRHALPEQGQGDCRL